MERCKLSKETQDALNTFLEAVQALYKRKDQDTPFKEFNHDLFCFVQWQLDHMGVTPFQADGEVYRAYLDTLAERLIDPMEAEDHTEDETGANYTEADL
jgi:hypothetical protein